MRCLGVRGRRTLKMTNDELQSYIDKYKKLLLESVEWWQKYTPDTNHCGF